MLGGYISDLEKGDVFKPIQYVLTPFMVSEYAHGVEDTFEPYHSKLTKVGRQVRPPTMIHADKMRILEENCDKEKRVAGMKGPDARVHYEYHAKHHSALYVGETVVCTTTRSCMFAGSAVPSTDHLKVRRLFSGSSLAEPLSCTVQPLSFVSVNAAVGARF